MILLSERSRIVDALLSATVAQGFSPEVARAGLEAEVASWSREALDVLATSLPSDRRPRVVLVIAARTLPASALRQCVLARSLGARVLLKCAAGQEAMAYALHAIDPEIVPRPFASDDTAALASAIAAADTIVVLGSDATVAAVRRATPSDRGFAAYGHKVSAAWLGAAPSDATLDGLARDLLAWDQAGCLAPQVIWSESAIGERLIAAIAHLEASLPLADLSPHQIARQRTVPLVAMLGGEILCTQTMLVATLPDATFRPSPGPRIAWLLPPDRAALEAIAPILSTLGTDMPAVFAFNSPTRSCAPGEMQRPPLTWHQDGLHPLASLLRPSRP